MRNNLRGFFTIVFMGLFIAGCSRGVHLITTETIPTPEPTENFTPISTLSPTLTPLPPFNASPTETLAPLPKGIFEPFPEEFYDNTVKIAFGVVSSGAMVEEQVLIDSSIGKMRFTVFWRDSDLDVTLVQPDGSLINPSVAESARNISFTSDSTSEGYWIRAPQTGLWTVRIFGKSTTATDSNYMLEASAVAATTISANFDKEEYSSGDPITLTASIEDSFSDSPRGPEYIFGVTWQVIVENPERTQYSFELYDDGLHGDGESDNGVYANTFENTLLSGRYNFYIQVSGANNRETIKGDEGKHFTRVYFRSIVVH